MKIGIPKEVKDKEARVAATPEGVSELVGDGHVVVVETAAGLGSGYADKQYKAAGALVVLTAEAWNADLIVKVKEPQESEYQYLNGQMVFTFFHLAGVSKKLTEALIKKKVAALAYESLEDERGRLPILEPMSAIAGNMSVAMGVYYLASFNQGNGMQLGSILGKAYGKVVVIGDGIVGWHAVNVASAMGAQVIVMGLDGIAWAEKNSKLLPNVEFVASNQKNIAEQVVDADLVVGAVLCRGVHAPKVVTQEMIKTMQQGAVIVDVSIDQGGCVETSIPTSHSEPVFVKHGVTHYCVSNMPGAYPKAATIALTNVTIAYVKELAQKGLEVFLADKNRRQALNAYQGKLVVEKLAKELGLMSCYQSIEDLN